jgi:hypothetical protein
VNGSARDRPKIVVSGMVGGDPHQGGASWAVLQYVLGFRQLGFEVLLVEQCKEEQLRSADGALARSASASYFRHVVNEFGLEDSASLLLEDTTETVGVRYADLMRMVDGAALLVNISGLLTDERLTAAIPVRAYVDLDPAFNQLWQLSGIDMRFGGHTHFITVGQAIGTEECAVPTCDRDWIPTVPPVVLERWPKAGRIETDAFTTVGNWRGYGSIEDGGVHYGQKAHSLRKFVSLPTRADASFALALSIHEDERKDLATLAENGWSLVDPQVVAGTPSRYQRFIQGSRAEFGIAKSGYVVSGCGWFSDRSACYLASGRPVLGQETGFSRFLPTGEGLFAFETVDDVVAQVDVLRRDYARHSQAARSLAEQHFDSDKVLTRLLGAVGLGK